MSEKTPPPVPAEADDAAELLETIRSNPEAAHILAEIARGGNAAELLATLGGPSEPEAAPEPPAEAESVPEALAPETRQALYAPVAAATECRASAPAFLSNLPASFWQ